MIKLQKRNDYYYAVVGNDQIYISKHQQYRNMKHIRFKGMITTYTAILRPLIETGNPDLYEIARGHKLSQVKERLARYLADKAANSLGERHLYGFGGDHRSMAKAEVL